MPYRAAVRFNHKDPGKRGPVDWYNEHDPVPDEVAEVVDARCVYEDVGALAGFPAGGTIDDIAGWVLEAGEDSDLKLARCQAARAMESEGKRRRGLLTFLDDQINVLGATPEPVEEEEE